MNIISYSWPQSALQSLDHVLTVNGQRVFVHESNVAAFAIFSFVGGAHIRVETAEPIRSAVVRPLKWNDVTIENSALDFELPGPKKVSVEVEGLKPLFLFAGDPEIDIPDRNDPSVHFFEAGKFHEAGDIELHSGETLYLEGGAIVRGKIRAVDAGQVCVRGRGILDGGWSEGVQSRRRMAVFENCADLRIEGITMIHPENWMISLGVCDRVEIRDIRQIGEVVCSDGIDIVGSCEVLVEDCFLRNNDDCIAIKALDPRSKNHDEKRDWRRDVRNVLVQHCVMLNAQCGNAMEIGFETRAESIREITFRDCDVIAAHGEGGVFTIHAGDRAIISDVTYEDIRVEHFYDKFIDFRILHSRYSKDEKRGQIRNVTFRRIRTNADRFGAVSLIGGLSADHTIENIMFDDLVRGDQKITNADELHLFSKHARGIVYQ